MNSDISTITIPSGSNTGKTGTDYKNYLTAYSAFATSKVAFAPRSTVKVDSQFSERLAADLFGFDVDHSRGLDGINPSTNKTYEVKGTGFSNDKARFDPKNRADHVIWIKVRNGSVEIREIDVDVYNHLDTNGFVNINKNMKQKTLVKYTY